jgi:hypothetical protein
LFTLQPELTNEVLLLVSDFVPNLPFREDPPLAGVLPAEDRPLELVGVEATGAFATGVAGATGAGATAAGTTEPGALEETALVSATLLLVTVKLTARAGGAVATLATATPIAGALLRAIGIAAPADAADRLGGSLSAGVPAGLSARPIAKQQRKAITHSSIETANARAYVPTTRVPIPIGSRGMRKLFMMDTLSGSLRPS